MLMPVYQSILLRGYVAGDFNLFFLTCKDDFERNDDFMYHIIIMGQGEIIR